MECAAIPSKRVDNTLAIARGLNRVAPYYKYRLRPRFDSLPLRAILRPPPRLRYGMLRRLFQSSSSQPPPSQSSPSQPPSSQSPLSKSPPSQPPPSQPPPSQSPPPLPQRPPLPPGADPDLWRCFSAVDTDKSGSITVTELQSALVNRAFSFPLAIYSSSACLRAYEAHPGSICLA